ncbi:MAG: hypothetical protein EOM90_14875 [Alphaproteobacteria bacterium]|nr:hypothetical protein [Alphaproteobacteria bacterium]
MIDFVDIGNKKDLKKILPLISIVILFMGIAISPIVRMGKLELWHLVTLLVIVINVKHLVLSVKEVVLLLSFVIFTFISFFLFTAFDPALIYRTILKQVLFTVSFSVFLLVITYKKYILEKYQIYILVLNVIVILITGYGLYQCFGRILDLPFTGNEYLRFRSWKIAGIYQISSVFEEPAFYGQCLVSFLFIHLLLLKGKYKLIIFLLIINIILTLSVGTYVITAYILFVYLFSFLFRTLVEYKITKARLLSLGIVILSVIGISQSTFFSYVSQRFSSLIIKDETLKTQQRIRDDSGETRLQNELKLLKSVSQSEMLYSGYGINYENSLNKRKMALNGFTEITVRWGFIGLFFFILLFTQQIFYDQLNKKMVLTGFLILYFFMDGAIAKASFWFFPGLTYLFCKLTYGKNNQD